MKIVITSDAYLPMINGVVTSILNLKEELTALGHEVRVLALSNQMKAYREKGAYYLPAFNANMVYPDARVAACLRHPYVSELIDWQPDIVHSQSEFTSFYFARHIAKKVGAVLVHTYHTLYDEYTHYFSPSKAIGRQAVAQYMRHLTKPVDLLIAPTEKTQKALLNYGIKTPIEVIPTGIELRHFTAAAMPEEERKTRREALGIAPADTLLISLGRVGKEKKIDQLIEFLQTVEDKTIKLLVVGSGPALVALQGMVAAKGIEDRVIFTGMVQPAQVPEYYKLADVFACASESEAQGLTYIEALASGLPLLCKKDQCLEGVLEEGKNGYSFEDLASFTKGLTAILKSPGAYAALCTGAKKTAGKFSAVRFAQNMETVYVNSINKQKNDAK